MLMIAQISPMSMRMPKMLLYPKLIIFVPFSLRLGSGVDDYRARLGTPQLGLMSRFGSKANVPLTGARAVRIPPTEISLERHETLHLATSILELAAFPVGLVS